MGRIYTVYSDGERVGEGFPTRQAAVNSEAFTASAGRRVEVRSPSLQVVAVRIAKNIVGYNNEHRMPEDREEEA